MPIRLKILFGALALVLVTGGFGLYTRVTAERLGTLSFKLYDDAFMAMSYLRAAQNGVLLGMTQDGLRPGDIDDIQENLGVARDRAMSDRGRAAAISLIGQLQDLRTVQGAEKAPAAALLTAFDNAVELFAGDAFRYRREVGDSLRAAKRGTAIGLLVSIFLALLITLTLASTIVPDLREAASVAQSIAAGRLDNRIRVRGRSETGLLLRALAAMPAAIRA